MHRTALGALMALWLLASGAAQAAAAAGSAPTRVARWSPLPRFVAVASYRGFCWTESIAAPARPDAYRCATGNLILDPCFVLRRGEVACPLGDPAVHRGWVLHLDRPLPAASPPGRRPAPWAMLLRGGVRCSAATGTTLLGYTYTCSNGDWCAAPVAARGSPRRLVARCGPPAADSAPPTVTHPVAFAVVRAWT